jgi:hypothetical protein
MLLASKSQEGTVNERTLLAWNRSFFGALFITLTIVKLFEPSRYIFATAIYFILIVCIPSPISVIKIKIILFCKLGTSIVTVSTTIPNIVYY